MPLNGSLKETVDFRCDGLDSRVEAIQRTFSAKFEVINDSFNDKLISAVAHSAENTAIQIKNSAGVLFDKIGVLIEHVDTESRSGIEHLAKEVHALSSSFR